MIFHILLMIITNMKLWRQKARNPLFCCTCLVSFHSFHSFHSPCSSSSLHRVWSPPPHLARWTLSIPLPKRIINEKEGLTISFWCSFIHSGKGVAEQGSQTKGWRGVWQKAEKKNCDLTDFDGGSCRWCAQRNFGWFSWSLRCVWVAEVTVLAVLETRRVFWTHWHPLNPQTCQVKMVKKW